MIGADFHLHTTVSFDGSDPIEAMCAAAQSKGIDVLCFTEHDDAARPKQTLDVGAHKASLARARAAFPALDIRTGIEIGYDERALDVLAAHIAQLAPDFVLLSVHDIAGLDPYHADAFFKDRTRAQGMTAYLEAVLRSVRNFNDYDAVAHLGYAGRYAPTGEVAQPLAYSDGPALIDAILRTLIARDKALEANTSQMRKGGHVIPGHDIWARYHALGGRLLTIGSDAHEAGAIASGFDVLARDLLKLGFEHYITYRERVATRLPLAEGIHA